MTKRFFTVTASVVAMAISMPAWADGLSDMMTKLPPPQFSSEKSSLALEYCIGLGISDWLLVGTLHGEHRTLVVGNVGGGALVSLVIAIDDIGATRSIAFHTGKGRDDRTESVIKSCL